MDRFALPLPVGGFQFSALEVRALQSCPFDKLIDLWAGFEEIYGIEGVRALGRQDRFYLLTQVLGRVDALHPWIYARCREVEADPDDYLDLWAREHYKSTVITFAGIIQEILRDPEITVGIFSHTRPVSAKFLKQIKFEFEANEYLKGLYPDVLYAAPERESPRWNSEGIVVRRRGNPKEATLEAWGLVDGQPTGAHFKLRVYDDVVTRESVNTPDQVQKTTEAWSLSDNLGAKGEGEDGNPTPARKWHIGTRYSFGDSYAVMIKMGALKPRVYPATDTGSIDGRPVFFTREQWAEKRKTQVPSVLAAQLLQNPAAGNEAMFNKDWLRYIDIRPRTLNIYIMGDPARSKKKNSDKTAIAAIAVDAGRNKYLIDGYHHRMNMRERWVALKNLWTRWSNEPGVQLVRVGWERYGLQNDIEYFEERMEVEGIAFQIDELAWPQDQPGSKVDRIERLVPDFQNGKFFLIDVVDGETANQRKCREEGEAFRILRPVKRRDENQQVYSLNKGFLEQFFDFPFVPHEDLLDAASRIYDMDPRPPQIIDERATMPEIYADGV